MDKQITTSLPTETVFVDGGIYFDSLIKDIEQAKDSITLETYIFQRDSLGKKMAEALANAANRGVKVRVMVDGAGTPFWSTQFARTLERAGATTKVFYPFPWQLWNWSRSVIRASILTSWLHLLLRINSRNHRKICLIDHRIGYVGSMNISKCHLSSVLGGDNWRDTSVRIEGADLSDLYRAFELAWDHLPITERVREAFRHVRRNPMVRSNHTRHRRRILYKNLLRKMLTCRQHIWITNAYFVPDNFLLRRLQEAAKAGVDVRILLPKKSDVAMMPWASTAFYFNLLKAGVRIFEYMPGILHAKTLLLDDWALIGSSNLNHRSLLHDLEVDVLLSQPESIQILQKQFLIDLQNSREISLARWHILRPRYQRWLGRLLLYAKYWI
ncbi:MAG: cardiolipin synthase B [Proteobacteria bacterium]|nr:cardiolipin synthase B [Pseudomonadota bacterium]